MLTSLIEQVERLLSRSVWRPDNSEFFDWTLDPAISHLDVAEMTIEGPYGRRRFSVDPENLQVSAALSPNDAMYGGNMEHYLSVGRSALCCIGDVMKRAGASEPRHILDFPCGHGRVMRALRAAFPEAQITGSDLDPDAVDYCRSSFNAIGMPVTPGLEASCPDSYDLIWCGSLLTHLPASQWDALLMRFERLLAPGGVLVLTTHGGKTAEWLRQGRTDVGMSIDQMYGLSSSHADKLLAGFDQSGFGYVDYPEQTGYGLSLTTIPWAIDLVHRTTQLSVVACLEHGWDDHQDVVGCVKALATGSDSVSAESRRRLRTVA